MSGPELTEALVTVAIPVYNASGTVAAAIRSALAQDWPNLEVVVLDDASTDGTAAIVEGVVRAHTTPERPIQLIRTQHNGGVAVARNRLLEAARGDFVAFFDDDDVSAPQRVRRQVERLLEVERTLCNNLVICHSARWQVFPDGARHYEGTMGVAPHTVPVGRLVAERVLIGRMSPGVVGSCATCSQLARRSLYYRLGGFDERFRRAEDTDLTIRLALAGGAFAGLAEPLVEQTVTGGLEKNLAAEEAAYEALLVKYEDYLREIGWLDFCRRWAAAREAYRQNNQTALLRSMAGLAVRAPLKFALRAVWSMPARAARRAAIRAQSLNVQTVHWS